MTNNSSISKQASALVAKLQTLTNGSMLSFRIHHSPKGQGFDVYAFWVGEPVLKDGTPIQHIPDLETLRVLMVLDGLVEKTKNHWFGYIHAHVSPQKKTRYFFEGKHSAKKIRISSKLAEVINDSADLGTFLVKTSTTRFEEKSLSEYIELNLYEAKSGLRKGI